MALDESPALYPRTSRPSRSLSSIWRRWISYASSTSIDGYVSVNRAIGARSRSAFARASAASRRMVSLNKAVPLRRLHHGLHHATRREHEDTERGDRRKEEHSERE